MHPGAQKKNLCGVCVTGTFFNTIQFNEEKVTVGESRRKLRENFNVYRIDIDFKARLGLAQFIPES